MYILVMHGLPGDIFPGTRVCWGRGGSTPPPPPPAWRPRKTRGGRWRPPHPPYLEYHSTCQKWVT